MSDENEITEEDRPHQTVRRMPDDQPEVGPFFPSGMSAPEAALAGATANLTEEQVAQLKGEEVEQVEE
jgi:hypothetical protein